MIPIVFSTDHNYVSPTGVTIYSLLSSDNLEQYHIFILAAPDVTTDDRELLEKQVQLVSPTSKIEFIDLGDKFKSGYEVRGISLACYYRLLIPWLIPQYDKVIYSDVDIIFQFGLKAIYDTPMEQNYFMGVNPIGFRSGTGAKYIKKLKLSPVKYINSGFLIINSQLQRKDNLKDEFLTLSKNKYLFQDQDIINLVSKDRIGLLPENYNMSPIDIEATGQPISSFILHYSGIKPWEGFTVAWVEWWNMCRRSLFYNEDKYLDTCKKILSYKYIFRRLVRSIQYNIRKYFL